MIGLAVVYYDEPSLLGVILAINNQFYCKPVGIFIDDHRQEDNCFFLLVEDL